MPPRVRVLGREEPSALWRHLAKQVVERLRGDPREVLAAEGARGEEIHAARASRCRRASFRSAARASARRRNSDGSRRRPGRTCRPQPSSRASSRRSRGPRARPCGATTAAANSSRMAGGNLGAPPKPPCTGSKSASQRSRGRGEDFRPDGRAAGKPLRVLLEVRDHLRGGRLEVLRALAPGADHGREHRREPGPAPAILGREVRPAVEGPAVRRQKEREGPSAGAGHRLDRRHVDVVHVGPLLAIDLDRDEVAVERAGDLRVLERLVLHDVAPVTGRVADREEDRLAFRAGLRERFLAPGVPVDRVVLVLKKVRTGLGGQAIRHGPSISPRRGGIFSAPAR